MRKIAALALLLLFTLPLVQAYTDHSFSVTVSVRRDGTAHVREKTIVYMDNQDEVDAFKNNLRLGKSTLLDWKKFSDNIRYHIGGKTGLDENLSITAGPEYSIGERARSITMDYDLATPFVNITQAGSRTTRYALREDMLGFERNEINQFLLGNNVDFSIVLPAGATITKNEGTLEIAPSPYKYDAASQTVTWFGPMTGKWVLGYEIEEPLSIEVYGFFSNLYKQALALAPLVLFVVLTLVVLMLLLKMRA